MKNQSMKRRTVYYATIALLLAVFFLVNCIMLVLSNRSPLYVDLTATGAFEIGSETKALLGALDKAVSINVLASKSEFDGSSYLVQARRMIEQYPMYSEYVTLNFVDYASDPTFASKYPDLTLSEGNLIVSSGSRVKQLALAELFNYAYDNSGNLQVLNSRAEEAVTGAIQFVVSDTQARAAIIGGYGVTDMPALTSLLEDNNYIVDTVNLSTGEIGDEYDVAVLLAPQTDIDSSALTKLDSFLYNGGAYGKTLIYTADVSQKELTGVETFLREWGVEIGDGAVFETVAERTYQYQPYYPVADYAEEYYKNMLIDTDTPMLMPLARPLGLAYESRDNRTAEVLLSFASSAGVRPSDAGEDFTVADATLRGPLPALIKTSLRVYKGGELTGESRVMVAASTSMLEEFAMQNTGLANGEYVLNLFNDVCDRTDVVSIQPKSLAGRTLSVSTGEANTLGIILAGALPLAILAAGIVIWLRRRYQ